MANKKIHKSKSRGKSKSKSRGKSKSKIKSKSKGRRVVRKQSNSKGTWEKFIKNKDSRKALAKSWSAKNPQKYYKSTITKLVKKYSNKK